MEWIIIPLAILVAILTAIIGSGFTNRGLKDWYPRIKKPSWTPPGYIIGIVWTIIYILTTISVIFYWLAPRTDLFLLTIFIFLLNAFLNAFWSYLFFTKNNLTAAFWEANLLNLSVITLIIITWQTSLVAALLLFPYTLWVTFATYLTYKIWQLNK